MPRDYKPATRKPRKKPAKKQSGSFLPFLSGLAVGLFVALLVYLQIDIPDKADTTAGTQAEQPPGSEGANVATQATTQKPHFDFYTILPEREVKVPDWQFSKEEDKPEPKAVEQGSYVLQVGSFQKFEDADRVKASLALRGITAEIQRVIINGQDVWYRVRIGPFQDPAKIQAMRSKLAENKLDFILLRIREEEEEEN